MCTIVAPVIDEEFTHVRELGHGSQATINLYQAQREDKLKSYAVKTYQIEDLKEQEILLIRNEIQFLRELIICDNFIHLDSVFATKTEIMMVMKFARYGSLKDYQKKSESGISEEIIRSIMSQLLLAVDLMHRKNIIHRDLKPDNILIADEDQLQICIADLGLACKTDDQTLLKGKCGTPNFVDPDVLKGFPFQTRSDLFSCGSILFNLVNGKYLFSGNCLKDVIMKNKFNDPMPIVDATCQNVSDECRDLMKQMLCRQASRRPSAEECLQHEWFRRDRQSLQNMLTLNKNPAIAYSLGSRNSFNSSVNDTSLILGPNYFQDLGPLEEDNQIKNGKSKNNTTNQLCVPIGNYFKSRSPTIKFRYNRLLSDNSIPEQNRQQSEENEFAVVRGTFKQLSFREFREKENKQKILVEKENIEVKQKILIEKENNVEEDFVDEEEKKEEDPKDQSTLFLLFNSFANEEYTGPNEEIQVKVTQRSQIKDIFRGERLMVNKNTRCFSTHPV